MSASLKILLVQWRLVMLTCVFDQVVLGCAYPAVSDRLSADIGWVCVALVTHWGLAICKWLNAGPFVCSGLLSDLSEKRKCNKVGLSQCESYLESVEFSPQTIQSWRRRGLPLLLYATTPVSWILKPNSGALVPKKSLLRFDFSVAKTKPNISDVLPARLLCWGRYQAVVGRKSSDWSGKQLSVL